MLDIKFIRENKDIVAAGAKKKRIDVDLDHLIALDEKRRELQATFDEKRAEQNVASGAIASAKSDAEKQEIIVRMSEVKKTLQLAEESLQEVMKEWRILMLHVPNVPDISVPEGESDADNQEIKKWGDIPEFDFEIKSHVDLMLYNDMADFERGAKVAGFRGYFLKNDGARLVWALERFVQDAGWRISRGHRGGSYNGLLHGRDLGCEAAADQVFRLQSVLSPRSGKSWQRYQGRLSHPRIREIRAGGAVRGLAPRVCAHPRGAHRKFRETPAGIEAAISRGGQLRRRFGPGPGEKVRHRSVDAKREEVSRDTFLKLLPRFPNAPPQHPLSRHLDEARCGRARDSSLCALLEQHCARDAAHSLPHCRKLSAKRRFDKNP